MAAAPDDFAVIAEQITEWMRESAQRAGATRLVLGLSGGIDSAVVCALAARALRPEAVVAAMLPIYSRPGDLDDARLAAAACGVTPFLIDLGPTFDTLLAAMPEPGDEPKPMALANIKPRLRMTSLYYLANQYNGLVVGTGNKTELAIGYFTKHGDGGVDLLPLGDLDKTAVRALARALGVPEPIITKAPSAGLWEGQTDEAEIGLSYEALDSALAAIGRGDEAAIDPVIRDRVTALMAGSEHKRQPAPIFRMPRNSTMA